MEEEVGKSLCSVVSFVPLCAVLTLSNRNFCGLTLKLPNIGCQQGGQCSGNSLNLHSGVLGSFSSRKTGSSDEFMIFLFLLHYQWSYLMAVSYQILTSLLLVTLPRFVLYEGFHL